MLPTDALFNRPPTGGALDLLSLLGTNPAKLRRISRQLRNQHDYIRRAQHVQCRDEPALPPRAVLSLQCLSTAAGQLSDACLLLAAQQFSRSTFLPVSALENRPDLKASYRSQPGCADFLKHHAAEIEASTPGSRHIGLIFQGQRLSLNDDNELWVVFTDAQGRGDMAALYLTPADEP